MSSKSFIAKSQKAQGQPRRPLDDYRQGGQQSPISLHAKPNGPHVAIAEPVDYDAAFDEAGSIPVRRRGVVGIAGSEAEATDAGTVEVT
jgi:hypothetical protein